MEPETLAKILELSRKLAETREVNPMLHYAMQEAVKLVNAEYGYLLLFGQDGSLEFRVSLHRDGSSVPDTNDRVSHTIIDEVLNTQQEKLVIDALDEYGESFSVNKLRLRSVICAPLISKGNIIGVIYLENRGGAAIFKREDLVPLTLFANQAAVLIENAILNETLEQRVDERTSELNTALTQLQRSWQSAIEANQRRTTFLANLSHDIRAPLSVALGATDLLMDKNFPIPLEDQYAWLDRIRDSLNHVTQLTDDLFTVMHADNRAPFEQSSFTVMLSKHPTDLAPFLERLHAVGMALPWESGVRFIKEVPKRLPIVNLDEMRIRQVVFNLLANALKFTDKGEVILYAEECGQDAQEVMIGVRDTGVGIQEEMQEIIFERFQAGANHSKPKHISTGLGLAICRELVELHGGRMWVESQWQAGSDFKFTLPLQ